MTTQHKINALVKAIRYWHKGRIRGAKRYDKTNGLSRKEILYTDDFWDPGSGPDGSYHYWSPGGSFKTSASAAMTELDLLKSTLLNT